MGGAVLAILPLLPVGGCQTVTQPVTQPVEPPKAPAANYQRNRLAKDIFEVKCWKRFKNPEKDADLCILNAILWALNSGYPYFVELEPEFLETGEGYAEPLTSETWVKKTIWGLKKNPGVLEFMYDGLRVVDSIRRKYASDIQAMSD